MNTFKLDAMLNMFPLLIKYLPVTISMALLSLVIALVAALMLAMVRLYKVRVLYTFSNIYVSFFRGTPLVVQLYLFFYGIPQVVPALKGIDRYYAAVIGLSLNAAAYMAETLRGAVSSVEKGQMEAALSVGMTQWQAMRRIILPQAARVAIPSLANNFIDLIKGSSLAFTLGVAEIMAKAQMTAAGNYRFFESYSALALVYWAVISFFGHLQKILEKKLSSAY